MPTPRTKSAPSQLSRGTLPPSLTQLVLKGCASPDTRRAYSKAIDDFQAFAASRTINSGLLYDWRAQMALTLSSSTVNLRLSAIRAVVRVGLRQGVITPAEAIDLTNVAGLPFRGTRIGNWITLAQTQKMLAVASGKNLRRRRNYMILSILASCALRLNDLKRVEIEQIQQRDGRWVFADLVGKGGRVRTVTIPTSTKQAIDAWLKESRLKSGRLVRQLTLQPEGLSGEAVRRIVSKAAAKVGIQKLGPHDLRRTCARLCREAGNDLEQIQIFLGHGSLVTTQRYLGTVQRLRSGVNDNIGL